MSPPTPVSTGSPAIPKTPLSPSGGVELTPDSRLVFRGRRAYSMESSPCPKRPIIENEFKKKTSIDDSSIVLSTFKDSKLETAEPFLRHRYATNNLTKFKENWRMPTTPKVHSDFEDLTNKANESDQAQAKYPSSSCVFVANLLQAASDHELEASLQGVFGRFGTVYIKVRRDIRHMPFAFCQYTRDEDAFNAVRYGAGQLICGRPCRTEKSKANRLFFVQKAWGPKITVAEAKNLLGTFGQLEKCYATGDPNHESFGMNGGVIVEFDLYDDGQKASNVLRNNNLFRLLQIHPSGTKKSAGKSGGTHPANSTVSARLDLDRRSIFVGNLPENATKFDICLIFGKFGRVRNIEVHESDSKYIAGTNVYFAFVELESGQAVDRVLASEETILLHNQELRVAQKISNKNRNGTLANHEHRLGQNSLLETQFERLNLNQPNLSPNCNSIHHQQGPQGQLAVQNNQAQLATFQQYAPQIQYLQNGSPNEFNGWPMQAYMGPHGQVSPPYGYRPDCFGPYMPGSTYGGQAYFFPPSNYNVNVNSPDSPAMALGYNPQYASQYPPQYAPQTAPQYAGQNNSQAAPQYNSQPAPQYNVQSASQYASQPAPQYAPQYSVPYYAAAQASMMYGQQSGSPPQIITEVVRESTPIELKSAIPNVTGPELTRFESIEQKTSDPIKEVDVLDTL